MYKLFLITVACVFAQEIRTNSPDGKFSLTIETKEEGDLQTRYLTKLTDNSTRETIEIAKSIRRDLPPPNYYWDKHSRYLIFEQCDEGFKDSRIRILDLNTKVVEFELVGLIGNRDHKMQQFDSENNVLIYFDTSTGHENRMPSLWAFDIATKAKKKLVEFDLEVHMEFPAIRRANDKRQLTITYLNVVSGRKIIKQLTY